MNPTRLAWTLLLIPFLSGCPTKTVYDNDGGMGGSGGATGKGGQAGTGSGGRGGTAGDGPSSINGGTSGSGGAVTGTGGSAGMGAAGGTTMSAGTGGLAGTGGITGTGGVVGTGGIAGSAGHPTGGAGGRGTGGAAGSATGGGGPAGSGSGGAATGGMGAAGRGGAGGTVTGPHVVNAYPADGQTGVSADVKITISFSAPMDQNSVKLAYTSSTILPGQATFNWDSTGTVLTVTPTSPLAYAMGGSSAIVANHYSYQISTAAKDSAGTPMTTALSVTFSTLKEISTFATATGVYMMLTATPTGSQPTATACNGSAQPGRQVGLAFVADLVMYVTFSIPQPPAGLYAVQTADLFTLQSASVGNPYGSSSLTIDEIPYESPPTFPDNTVKPVRTFGVFASNDTQLSDVSVLPAMQEAFTGSGHGLLFRFQFGTLPSMTSYANFSCTDWNINYTYLIP